MRAALRILWDVLSYRLVRLEMANLVAAVSLSLALRLSFAEVVVRGGFALLLNLLVYLNNDFHDIEQDLGGGRDDAKTRFLAAHPRAAVGAQLGLVVALAAIAVMWDATLLVAAVAGGGICWAYSAWLKRRPYVDVLAMTLWGAAMPLVGVPLSSSTGILLVVQLGLFSTVFELIQVRRDFDHDRSQGVRTTAVALGPERTLLAARVAIVGASAYATLLLSWMLGPALLIAALLPVKTDPVRHWNRVRLVLGLVWLGLLGQVYFWGALRGALS